MAMNDEATGPDFETPAMSRTGIVCPLGKLEYPVKTHLPTGCEELFLRLVSDAGYGTPSEFVRDLILMRLYGKTFNELCADDRRALLTSEVPYSDQMRTKSTLRVVGEVRA